MEQRSKTIYTLCIAGILVALGVTDALFIESEQTSAAITAMLGGESTSSQGSSSSNPIQVVVSSSSSSSTDTNNPTGDAVVKRTGPDVLAVLSQSEFEPKDTTEAMFLPQIISDEDANVQSRVLSIEDDRVGLIAWAESPKVKIYYLAIKEALHTTFTSQLIDLTDETQRQEGKAPRNFLTFLDPGITEERIVFVRIRENIYELHIAEGRENEMFALLDELTK